MHELMSLRPLFAGRSLRLQFRWALVVVALVVVAFAIACIGLLVTRSTMIAATPVVMPAANSSENAAEPAAFSTPELIDQAYENGAISADERLLYLAYAVYEPDSLPTQFQSDVPWFGTSVVAELNLAMDSILAPASAAASGNPVAAAELEFYRLMKTEAKTVCGVEDNANSLQSTNFYLNYGSIGGGLNAQDYLDSLEATYAVEVSSYGWAKPPYVVANTWKKYPVQAASIGSGLYGYVTNSTSNGGNYTGFIGDNPNTAPTESAAYASCMVLNADFSTFPGGAQFALDVTAAHEFAHSIQFGVGDPSPREDFMWYESTAAYIEDDVLDAANDNYQYLWPKFDACLGNYSGGVYSNWLIFRYAAERNGGTNKPGGGEEIMQQFFANIAAGQRGQTAYDNALQITRGVNLKDTFHDYAIASRFMKSCPVATPYCFEEAAGYVAAKGTPKNHGAISTIGDVYYGSLLDNHAINWISLPATGTYTVTMENLSSGGQFRTSIVEDTGAGLNVTPLPNVSGAYQSVSLRGYTPTAGAKDVIAVITNQEKTADAPNACRANSYRLNTRALPVSFTRTYLPLAATPPSPPPEMLQASEDTMILQGYLTTNFCSTDDMWAGYDDRVNPDGEIARSLVKFDLSEIPSGTSIAKAAVMARHVVSWDYPDRSQTITAYAVKTPWVACSVTWANQPEIGAAYGSQVLPFTRGGWYEFDITELAQGWINGATPNNGIWLRGPENSGKDSAWRSFGTSESADKPYLAITYPGARTDLTTSAVQLELQVYEASTAESMLEQLGKEASAAACSPEGNSEQRCLDLLSD